MAIQSSFSLTGTLFKAAATGTAAAAAIQWSGHLVRCIQNLQTTPIGIVGTVSGGVVLVSALTDAAVQKFLSGVFKLNNRFALELFGTAAGLIGGYATTGLMQYEIVPLSLATGSPLVVLGCTAFLLWKLSLLTQKNQTLSEIKEKGTKTQKEIIDIQKIEIERQGSIIKELENRLTLKQKQELAQQEIIKALEEHLALYKPKPERPENSGAST